MDFLILLVILWAPYLVARFLRAQRARTPTPSLPQRAWGGLPRKAQTDTGSQYGPAWSALDDLQLTRLLTNSAPRTSTE